MWAVRKGLKLAERWVGSADWTVENLAAWKGQKLAVLTAASSVARSVGTMALKLAARTAAMKASNWAALKAGH